MDKGKTQVISTEIPELNRNASGEGRERPIQRGIVELGCTGHLIVGDRCRWKRHTQVGDYRVSTLGDYYPDRGEKRDTVGADEDSFFETMVFELSDEQAKGNEGCGCRAVKSWSEIEGERYATAGEAQAGHERYVAKYAALTQGLVVAPSPMPPECSGSNKNDSPLADEAD